MEVGWKRHCNHDLSGCKTNNLNPGNHLVLVLCSRTDCCCLRSLDREICQDHPFRYRLTHLSHQWDWSLCGRVQVYRQMWGKEPKVAVHPGPASWTTIYCLELIFCTVQIGPPVVFFSVKCVTEHLNLHATSESGHDAHVMGGLIWVNTLLLSTGTFKPSQSPGSVPGRIIQGNALG